MITNLQLARRKAAYLLEDDWDQFIDEAINQEEALLARIEAAEHLLDLIREKARGDAWEQQELAEVLQQIDAHFEKVAG